MKSISNAALLTGIGIAIGFSGEYLRLRLLMADLINPSYEAWEDRRYCDAFEGTLKAEGISIKNFSDGIGGCYARGECVRQDLTRAEKYYRQSGLGKDQEVGHRLFSDALMLARDDSPISSPEIRARFENLLNEAKKYGEPCLNQRKYGISDKSFKLFKGVLCDSTHSLNTERADEL